jgi:hypothetical protein
MYPKPRRGCSIYTPGGNLGLHQLIGIRDGGSTHDQTGGLRIHPSARPAMLDIPKSISNYSLSYYGMCMTRGTNEFGMICTQRGNSSPIAGTRGSIEPRPVAHTTSELASVIEVGDYLDMHMRASGR